MKPDWQAIEKADPDARNRYGFRTSDTVHIAQPGNVRASLCERKRCRLAIHQAELATCERCIEIAKDRKEP
jgi:hypothetical protein